MRARDRREDCLEARLHDARGSTGPEEPTLLSEDDFDVGSSHRVRAATERVLVLGCGETGMDLAYRSVQVAAEAKQLKKAARKGNCTTSSMSLHA
mgnify:CR=1 FL=1